jgi:transcription termination factor Rho
LVSVDSTELQRATLQRKDREELATIAVALGAKPTSRTKKADLVDMILAASADRSTAGEREPTEAPAPAPVAAAVAAEPAPAATPRAEPSGDRPQARLVGWIGDTAAEPPRQAATEPRPQQPSPAEPARFAGAAGSGTNGGPGPVAEPRRAPVRPDADADEGPDDADAEADADGDADERRGDGSEAGNRRRRRRGRDRNRGDDRVERPERPRDERGGDRPPEEPGGAELVAVAGHLDLRDEGYGFLRINGYLPSRDDAYVSVRQARQFGLRKGDYLTGASRPAGRNEKNPALLRIDSVNGLEPEAARHRPRFEDLTPLFPDERLRMEMADDPYNMTARVIDLIAPIGKGQRGLIVSPPKAGKTTVMKQIARSIEVNHPDVHLIVLLVDERPEEVTDMRRWLLKGEVAASTFDRPADEHIHVAELTIERAKRMVEVGRDVCIILDGITRLARAYNLGAPPTGRIMSGGIDTGALYPPKKFFGAARNIEEGGSLTILATALVETGSRMDEVIFEEFKGTGNMELRLDRRLAERRIFPAIDVDASSTRHEELLFDRKQLQQVWKLRRVLSGLAGDGDGGAAAGLELLTDRLKTFRNNDEFLAEVAKGPSA